MTPALYILHIVDDYGNTIGPNNLSYESYMARYDFFMGENSETSN